MTEEEKAILRLIGETTKQVVAQQEEIGRLIEEDQSAEAAVELLCALLDSIHVQQQRLEALRAPVKPDNSSN